MIELGYISFTLANRIILRTFYDECEREMFCSYLEKEGISFQILRFSTSENYSYAEAS